MGLSRGSIVCKPREHPVFAGGSCGDWSVPNLPGVNPGVAERAPWRSLQGGVAGVCSLLDTQTDSYASLSPLTPLSDPNTEGSFSYQEG